MDRWLKPEDISDNLIKRYPALRGCRDSVEAAYRMLERSYANGGRLYVAGNGGSAADSGHIAGELTKSFLIERPVDPQTAREYELLFGDRGKKLSGRLQRGLPAVPLPALSAVVTAVVNDIDGEYIFSQTLNAMAGKGDVFLGISTSGNSADVVNAMMVAAVKKMYRIGLTGGRNCELDSLCDVVIHVPETETYKVQELHLPVYHALCAMLELHFFGK